MATASIGAPASRPRGRRSRDRIFYTGVSALIWLVLLAGFTRSWVFSHWFETPPGTPKMTALLVAHGSALSAWSAFILVQPGLVAARNLRLHRRLGWLASAIALLALAIANLAAIEAMHIGFIGLGDPAAFYAIPFFGIWTFALLVALAVKMRGDAESHKRLMLLSSTQLMEPAIARLPISWVQDWFPYSSHLLCDWVLVAGIAYDLWSRGRVHSAWLWGGAIVIGSEVLRLLIWHSAPWLAFAHFMAELWWG
jgi:hypothetical protein